MSNRVGVNLRLEELEVMGDMLEYCSMKEGHESNEIKKRIVGAKYFREVVKKVQGWSKLLKEKKEAKGDTG